MKDKEKVPIGLLGATGVVGQMAIALVEEHPQFYISEISASSARVGKTYKDAATWLLKGKMPLGVENLLFKTPEEFTSTYILSALPSRVAGDIEYKLAQKGHYVFSNASAFRMDPKVPILIPEVNESHLGLLDSQPTSGKIITNSNCVAVFVCLALKPLLKLGTIKQVSVVTLQAISGAGYPGMSGFDIQGNIVPFIPEEENKIREETLKILGSKNTPASFDICAQVHRVPVLHGHTISLHIHFDNEVDREQAICSYHNNKKLYKVHTQQERPQPAKDIEEYDYKAHIGQIKQGTNKKILNLVVMGHNLVRGASGASLLNMEAFMQRTKRMVFA
ncbi:MAG: Aspartate-semialdehyde dehydrogenase 2 [Chlamydiae bacterium]|nr:Aspartate-semialdehyde dehydrogenase 2 [Chlamydiota bacterium]